jgi:hypothetical protein
MSEKILQYPTHSQLEQPLHGLQKDDKPGAKKNEPDNHHLAFEELQRWPLFTLNLLIDIELSISRPTKSLFQIITMAVR